MNNYLFLLERILVCGLQKSDRTGTGTRSLFGEQLKFDLRRGFPMMTTKKLPFKAIVTELCWFLRGETNTAFLEKHGCTIWREWQDENGELGPIYGAQWRNFGGREHANPGNNREGVDQIERLIHGLRKDPDGRRHIVSAWNPDDIDSMALPPCHLLFQFYVGAPSERNTWRSPRGTRDLHCHMYQRSADVFLGVPFNIASYALLTHIVAAQCGFDVGQLVISFGDVHLYNNHVRQAEEQLLRTPRSLPHLVLPMQLATGQNDLLDLDPGQFALQDYDPHPSIKAQVAI